MDEVIKKFNNLEDKIRSVLAEQYPDIFKSILKLNGKTEKIYDAIVSVSNAANVIKLKDIYNTCAPQDGERVQFDQNDDVQYTDPEKKQSQIDERKENFEKIYAIYPKKRGKQRAFGLYCQWLKGRVIQGERIKLTNKEMYVAVRNYVRQQEQEQPDQKYWKNFDTLMGATLLDYVDKGEINE